MEAPTPAMLLLLRAAAATPATPTRGEPKSRIVYDFPLEKLVNYMHMRQDEAAKALGVATITLKRICHRRKIQWTYRAYKTKMKRLAKALKLKETSGGGGKQARSPSLPEYCVYSRPVSAEVPALAPRALQVQYSTERQKLPSLTDALGSPVAAYGGVPFPAKERPHLSVPCDQPTAEPAPMLPRLNVIPTTAILHTPTSAATSPASKLVPVLSPSMTRFGLLPSTESSRLVARAISHI